VYVYYIYNVVSSPFYRHCPCAHSSSIGEIKYVCIRTQKKVLLMTNNQHIE